MITRSRMLLTLNECTVLGQGGFQFQEGLIANLCFMQDALEIEPQDGSRKARIEYPEVADLLISGPGSVATGGGFAGGGFGVDGALVGIAIASVLNRLTKKTTIHTFITLVTHVGELHLHYGAMEPLALRIALSEVFLSLRRLDHSWIDTRLQRIERLAGC